jgi:hypothetical protein
MVVLPGSFSANPSEKKQKERKEWLVRGGRMRAQDEDFPDGCECGVQLRYCQKHFPDGSFVWQEEAGKEGKGVWKKTGDAKPFSFGSKEGKNSLLSSPTVPRKHPRERVAERTAATLSSLSNDSDVGGAVREAQKALEVVPDLEEQMQALKKENQKLREQLNNIESTPVPLPLLGSFDPSSPELDADAETARDLTGMPTAQSTRILIDKVIEAHNGDLVSDVQRKPKSISDPAILLMTLVILRLGLTLTTATLLLRGAGFQFHRTYVGRLFRFGLRVWYNFFLVNFPPPTSAETRKVVHSEFIAALGDDVGSRVRLTIDCTEIQVEMPADPAFALECWSKYKHRYTLKWLVATSPDGRIVFVSDAYPGSWIDERITEDCGIMDMLNPGDVVLADKGFNAHCDFYLRDILLVRPISLREGGFDKEESDLSRKIASARVHVERAMRRAKAFSFFHGPLKQTQLRNISMAFKVVCYIGNFSVGLTFKNDNNAFWSDRSDTDPEESCSSDSDMEE